MATIEALQERLSQARLQSAENELLNKILALVEANVKKSPDMPVRTGNLRRTITHRVIKAGARGVVGTNASYARPVHQGSRPHIIRPRRAKMLRFQIGGKTIYTRQVNHPGTKGQPFLLSGLAASRDSIQQLMGEAGRGFFRGDIV